MPIKFDPNYTITSTIAAGLLRIEAVRERVQHLPLTPTVLASLRETARLYTTHYSTMIEGNRLEPEQIQQVLEHDGHFPGRERDEVEVKGYYAALNYVEQQAARAASITDKIIKTLHGLVMADGRANAKPTPYRDGQNVIRDGKTRSIVYLPPEAKDVDDLMRGLVAWVNNNENLPCPLVAGIAHYQFATIHPYYDGNGRTARLLTTLILHNGGYDLKGLYSLEEYYAQHLAAYYEAISVGESHNYYMGRAEADITKWVEYFIEGMATAFEKVLQHMLEAKQSGADDQSHLLRRLEPRQRKILELFKISEYITAKQIGEHFGFKPRTSTQLCSDWVASGFLEISNTSKKARKYKLAEQYESLLIKNL